MGKVKPASDLEIELMKRFWEETSDDPPNQLLSAKLLKQDFLALIARLKEVESRSQQPSLSPVRDKELSDLLAMYPDSTEVVIYSDPEMGMTQEIGMNVGLLTVILARCHEYERKAGIIPE